MKFEARRLRVGEWIVGVAALILLVVLFVLPWYGFTGVYSTNAAALGVKVTYNGWHSLTIIRFVVILVALGGLASWWLQATRPAPALPVCAIALTTALDLVLFLALYFRVLITPPGNTTFIGSKVGAFVGLGISAVLLVGGYVSLRQDGIAAEDAPASIETLRLAHRSPARGG